MTDVDFFFTRVGCHNPVDRMFAAEIPVHMAVMR
jgi:hypothetical protein